MASTSDAALKEEIARLTGPFLKVCLPSLIFFLTSYLGVINEHKSTQQSVASFSGPRSHPKSNIRPPASRSLHPPQAQSTRDVVIDGVTFESSTRSLVRKDCEFFLSLKIRLWGSPIFFVTTSRLVTVPKPPSAQTKLPSRFIPQQVDFSRTSTGHLIPAGRAYKPKVSSRARQRRPRNRNMTLNNTRGPHQSVPIKFIS
jgi:hypothetical protein